MISNLVVLNGSPSSTSRTAALCSSSITLNGSGEIVHLGELNAEALLARTTSDDVETAMHLVQAAGALFVVSPVYRRTYSGLLKAFFDLFGPSALAGMPVVLGVTAGHAGESLCIDHGLRPLVASLDGWSVPTAVYAAHADFDEGTPSQAILERLGHALAEAERLRP